MLIIGVIFFIVTALIFPPEPESLDSLALERDSISAHHYKIGPNWVKKNEFGLYELYVEGKPFERGVIKGKLTKELVRKQEDFFIAQIHELIPSKNYLRFLKYFVAWFNRDLDEYVPLEYQYEIYGVSESASDEYNYVGSKYQRMLNYHAAHDIGHALQDKSLVGCTSFSVWGDKSENKDLLVGRNFDFYVGDGFAEDKIIAFINPDSGHKFMMVTWGGMIGTLSGMNEKGLTVTINAAKSDPPLSSATPISIVAREILQYASNIDEAYRLAASRKTFVSESILIGSQADGMTAIIEKSPGKISLVKSDENYIVCSNHYQSKEFENDSLNVKNIRESASYYRHLRTDQLLKEKSSYNHSDFAAILRDRKGVNGAEIGMGNEKALNQLIAHHSIIFNPDKLLVWVSSNPMQLGAYVAYDLNKVFNLRDSIPQMVYEKDLTIAPDSFLFSDSFKDFKTFRKMRIEIKKATKDKIMLDESVMENFLKLNPEYYETYWIAGDYYRIHQQMDKARGFYTEGLKKEIATMHERKKMEEGLALCNQSK